jgi:hypothetical protein
MIAAQDWEHGAPWERSPKVADPIERHGFPENARLSAGMVFPHFGVKLASDGYLN